MAVVETKKQKSGRRPISGSGLVFRNFGFVIFLALIALVYIANSLNAEGKVRRIHELKDEVKELRSECIFLESEIMYNSTPSQMAKRVDGIELTARSGLPRRLKAVAEEH